MGLNKITRESFLALQVLLQVIINERSSRSCLSFVSVFTYTFPLQKATATAPTAPTAEQCPNITEYWKETPTISSSPPKDRALRDPEDCSSSSEAALLRNRLSLSSPPRRAGGGDGGRRWPQGRQQGRLFPARPARPEAEKPGALPAAPGAANPRFPRAGLSSG